MNLKLSAPMITHVELTEQCNHRCFYCYNLSRSSKCMSLEEIQRILNQTEENKIFSVVLTGGEPFMNRKGLYFALEKLNGMQIDALINTNLSMPLREHDLQILKISQFILVSFPTSDETKFNSIVGRDSYSDILKNLEKLVSSNIAFGVNQVVTQKNKEDVYKTGKFLFEKFNLNSFSASPIVPVRKEDMQYSLNSVEIINVAEDLLRLEKDFPIKSDMLECIPTCLFPENIRSHTVAHHSCTAGKDTISINAAGMVKKCPKLEKSYGNIFIEDLKIIWDKIMESKRLDNYLCNGCLASPACHGGCEARVNLGEGVDELVCGSKNPYEDISPKKIRKDKIYRMSKIRWREEKESLLIWGREDGFVFGNNMLLRFMQSLEGKSFNLDDVTGKFGEQSEKILSYLYNRGLVRDGV